MDACLLSATAALGEAESEHDHESAYHACEAVGRAYMWRGEPEYALAWYREAIERAMRGGLTRRLGGGYHDLALALRESGNHKGFKEKAAVAFQLYRDSDPSAPGITGLIADLAQGASERDPSDRDKAAFALQSWRAVPASMRTPMYHLTSAAQQMRAAALLSIRSRYDSATDALDRFYLALPDHEGAAYALAWASSAALLVHDYHLAFGLAEKAEGIATERGETVVAEMASEARGAALAERAM